MNEMELHHFEPGLYFITIRNSLFRVGEDGCIGSDHESQQAFREMYEELIRGEMELEERLARVDRDVDEDDE